MRTTSTTKPAPMTCIAAIDIHSGYVWGVTAVRGIIDDAALCRAAAHIVEEADGSQRYVVTTCHRTDADATLHLYGVPNDVPNDVDITDGQDQATIAAVEQWRYLGTVCNVKA